jgi:hypothetical protein
MSLLQFVQNPRRVDVDEMRLLEMSDPIAGRNVTAPSARLREALLARPRRNRRLNLVFALVVVAVGTAAAVMARTGIPSTLCWSTDGGEWTCDGTELIRLDGVDAATVVDEIAAGIPLPPGGTFDRWKAKNLGENNWHSELGLRGTLAYVAACQWTGYWLAAFDAGDQASMEQAAQMLEKIPDWPELVAVTPPEGMASYRERAAGARAGDPGRFVSEYQTNCSTG